MRFKEILKEFDDGLGAIGDVLAAAAEKKVKDTFKKAGSGNVVDKPGDLKSPTDSKKTGKPTTSKADTKAIQDPDFNKKLAKVADALGVKAEDLRAIIKTESGGNPKAQDPFGVSAGLIGFTRQTAKSLGTSREALLSMSAVEQLDYVYKFYKMNNLRPGSDRGTMYMITFMPAYAYAPDNTVLGQKSGGPLGKTGLSMDKIWSQNPVFGKSQGKSYFTVGDVKKLINSR